MVKSVCISPGWESFFSKSHERSLKAWYQLCAAFGISRGYHTALAWTVAKESDIADTKGLEFICWTKEVIFPKRVNFSQLKIGPKPPTYAFEVQFREPMS